LTELAYKGVSLLFGRETWVPVFRAHVPVTFGADELWAASTDTVLASVHDASVILEAVTTRVPVTLTTGAPLSLLEAGGTTDGLVGTPDAMVVFLGFVFRTRESQTPVALSGLD
jgi:hypothetical protein